MKINEIYNLPETMKFLKYNDEKDWLELRKKGIGGSDIGAIMGLNPYTSPLQIYNAKMGLETSDNDNIFTRKGKDLEDIIRERYVKPVMGEYGYKVIHPEYMMINPEYPFLRANLDGFAVGKEKANNLENIVIEIKFVSSYARCNWDKDEYSGVPAYYYAQVQEYMLVTGSNQAYVCALFEDKWEFKMYSVVRDEIFIERLKQKASDFYYNNMFNQIPPKAIFEIDKEIVVDKMQEPKNWIIDNTLDNKVIEYKKLDIEIKSLEKTKSTLYNEIMQAYADGRTPEYSQNTYTVSFSTRKTFDSTTFGYEHPELYQHYLKENTTARLLINKPRKDV